MKTLRTKVILSAFVLLFALVATIGSTYAWFTVSSTVSIPSMEINVQSVDNLMILVADDAAAPVETLDLSVPTNYKTAVSTVDILTVYDYAGYGADHAVGGGDDTDPWALYPVTALQAGYITKDAKLLNTMAVGNATNLDREVVVTSDKNSATGDFIELRFWVYLQSSDGLAKNIVLDNLSITSSAPAPQNDVVNAVRVALWTNDDYSVAGTGPYTYTFPTDAETAVIFGTDPDYDYAFVSTQPGYSTTAGTTDPLAAYTYADTEFNALTQIDTLISIPMTDDVVGTTAINSIEPETPTLVTARIYIEGWDAETSNDINSAYFSISFDFSIGA
ncbi:MAG: hypothetical protein JXB20_05085 [Bacilli bacterium]|nr:hypothetical protein [Bacilli bacterium]